MSNNPHNISQPESTAADSGRAPRKSDKPHRKNGRVRKAGRISEALFYLFDNIFWFWRL